MNHFNLGNVWGSVSEITKKKTISGKPYLQIEIECPNELYGNVKTYGRLYGEQKVGAFIDFHKSHPGQAYRFKGFFSQYDKEEGKRYSNYTFFSWQPIETREFRAAFVLTGEVTAIATEGEEGKICMHLLRKGQGSYQDIEEDFEVYTINKQEVAGIQDGQVIQAKGMLRAKEPEDCFGMPSGKIRPYVMEMRLDKIEAPEGEAF